MSLPRQAIAAVLVVVAITMTACVGSNPVVGDPSDTTTTTGVGA